MAVAGSRLVQAGERLTLEGDGWRLDLPWSQVHRAYHVRESDAESAWFLGVDGRDLLRIERRR